MPSISALPFLLHSLVEVPAAVNFFLRPSEQLPSPAPQAHAVIQQYAALLMVSAMISGAFFARPIDGTSRDVAGILSLYHLWPLARAYARVREGGFEYGKGLGGPGLHLLVHISCFVALFQLGVCGRFGAQKAHQQKRK